jgi:hypothetical protein
VGFDVQVEPSYSSVAAVIDAPAPPKAKAAVCVPAAAKDRLAVFKPVGLDVQVDPSYSSVAVVNSCKDNHQKLKLLFEYHNLLKYILLYLNL